MSASMHAPFGRRKSTPDRRTSTRREGDALIQRALPESSRLRPRRQTPDITATEPAALFALKSLMNPVVAVACLMACVLFWGESLSGPYFLIAVVSFLASAELLDVVEHRRRPGRYASLRSLLNIMLRWSLVMAFVWTLLHLSKLSDIYQFHVLASWALVTPPVLWLAETATQFALIRSQTRVAEFRKAVIIGLTKPGLRLEEQFNRDPSLRIQVIGECC